VRDERGEIETTLARHATRLPKITLPRTDDGAMHEVVTSTTSLAGAGAVALPAPPIRPAFPEPGAVPAYRVDGSATGSTSVVDVRAVS
jgi:hypothetical protein